MRLAFAGTPPFAATILQALVEARHDVVLVLTQPDRAKGRGLKASPSAVSRLAESLGLAQLKPVALNDPAATAALEAAGLDALVVAAYGLLLPKPVLSLPRWGCINVHASLLPRWRGAAPVQRAILAGDSETGVSIMQMEAGLDTGPIWLQKTLPITPDATAATLTAALASLGAQAMVQALAQRDRLTLCPQPAEGITYAAKITRAEATLNWALPSQTLARQTRAFDPFPGAESPCLGERLKIWHALPVEASGPPGRVVSEREGCPIVACGAGGLWLREVQRPGGRRMPAKDYQRGHPLPIGTLFG